MKIAGKARAERRSSAALIVSIVALAAASGGTAVAVEGFHSSETKASIGSIDKGATGGGRPVFKRLPVGDLGETVIAKGAGFKVRAICEQGEIDAYVAIPNGVAVDGVSDVDTIFGDSPGSLALTTGGGFQVSSFAIATKDGGVMSGNLGFDYPGSSGIFGGQNKCVVYGHVLVN